MIAAFWRYSPTTCAAIRNAISSPGSVSGVTHCEMPDGPMLDLFGQPLSPASPSAPPVSRKVMPTSAISPRCGFGSSASAALQSLLASKSARRLEWGGSTLFSYRWSSPATPAGRQYFRLAASGRRTSGQGCTGWPTPNAMEGGQTSRGGDLKGEPLMGGIAQLVSWATPRAEDGESAGMRHSRGVADTLTEQASWATPSSRDHKDSSDPATWVCTEDRERMDQLPRQVFGVMPSGSPAATGRQGPPDAGFIPSSWPTPNCTDENNSRFTDPQRGSKVFMERENSGSSLAHFAQHLTGKGQLNAALSRWLMGLPPEWDLAAIAAHRLIRTRRAKRG